MGEYFTKIIDVKRKLFIKKKKKKIHKVKQIKLLNF
jgi:hypothetical protein